MMDAGTLKVCSLTNVADNGAMPVEILTPVASSYYEDRVVGYGRYFAAKGVNEQVDLTVRSWRLQEARAGMYAVLSYGENDGQYRIVQVQHLLNEDGLKVTDLSLARLEAYYELADEAPENQPGTGNGSDNG